MKKEPSHIADKLRWLRDLIELNSDWIWEVDDKGRYVYSSAKGSELLGYPTEQILGRTPFDFMPPEEVVRIAGAFKRFVSERKPFNGLVNRVRRADGSITMHETSGVPIFWPDGRFKGFCGIDRDVSAVYSRVFQLESLYSLVPLPLNVVDRNLRYVAVNLAQAKLFGMTVENLLGQSLRVLRPQRAREIERDFALIDAGQPVLDREIEWKSRSFQVSTKPLRNMEGVVVALSIALTDITERKRAQRALADAYERLDLYAKQDVAPHE
ncbi:MAG: PAS domain S-box protein [Betaproteobacteria bacterium]|nr:PAS domain S-box protein [Betaproteobacteria bacterium]